MNKKNLIRKGEKGITLVALIITIIVLLILAVVAIRAVQGDGIISHAKNSQAEYATAQTKEEQRLLEYEYQIASSQGTATGTYDEYVLETKYGLKIGDYVNYTYDTVSAGYPLSKAHSGKSAQTITQSTGLKWRVLGLDKNGNVELISATPAKSISVLFSGAAGYNNGVYLLNDMCEKLYSNADLGIKARSLTIEDIEEQFSDAGKNARDGYKNSYNIAYGETKSYPTNNKYPVIYAEEAGSGTNGTIREGGIGPSVPFYQKEENLTIAYDKDGNAVKTAYTKASGSLNTTQTYYYFSTTPSSYLKNEIFHNMIFGTGTNYWLASRCVVCGSVGANFAFRVVGGADLSGILMFLSNGDPYYNHFYLRPVVSLGSGVSVDTSTGNGKAESMYEIVKSSS